MAENKKMLPDGMGMPYVAVFDGGGKAIIDPLTSMPIGTFVSNFTYDYKEEKDDECEITLETDNPNLIDIPQLKIPMPLRVQWGYIFPDGSSKSGPVRTVVIRDIDATYNEKGVKYVLKCTDAFSLTKNAKSDLKEQMFPTWVKNNLADRFTLEVVDFTVENKLYIKKIDDPNDIQRNK